MTTDDKSVLRSVCSHSYDILAGTISILDLLTDILVMLTFYNNNHMGFFGASLTTVLFAQIAYVATFIAKYSKSSGFCWNFCLFCILLFVAPLLSFVFMLVESEEAHKTTQLAQIIQNITGKRLKFDYGRLGISHSSDDSELKQWMKQKLNRHTGFILEAACMFRGVSNWSFFNFVSNLICFMLQKIKKMSKTLWGANS